jgi:hypothetical protein
MNKAFIREPEQGVERCPRCGSPGLPVQQVTLAALLTPAQLGELAQTASFCPYPPCEIAYFDMFERVVLAAALERSVYPKDPRAAICPCFGLTTADIEQDIDEGVVTRTRAAVAQAKSPAARCQQQHPAGHSCVADVQRYYMQRKAAREES